MKNYKQIVYLLLVSFLIQITCKKEETGVSTGEVSDILCTTAEVKGYITSFGEGIRVFGHCYSKTPDPTVYDAKTTFGVAIGKGSFTSFLLNLEPGTKYYTRAYVVFNFIAKYSNEISFTTAKDTLPELTTTAVLNITQNSAVGGGTIMSQGGTPVIERGVCWSISDHPTISDCKTSDGPGTGAFTSKITGLTANTSYHVRAYATKISGTTYGNEVSFSTLP